MKEKSDQIVIGGQPLFKKPIPLGYQLRETDGVYSLLTDEFRVKLGSFQKVFEEWQKKASGQRLDPASYNDLPHALNDHTWRARQQDLKLITDVIGNRKKLTILELGSWQGWLANQLSQMGHHVLAIDYFADQHDGLQARRHYQQPTWCSLHLDVEDLLLLNPIFDMVIFNRNLCYCPGVSQSLLKAKKLLKPDGNVIATGINIVDRPKNILDHFKQMETFFRQRDANLYLKEDFKKYLCHEDFLSIQNAGFSLFEYPLKWYQKIRNTIDPKASRHFWAMSTS